MTATTHNATRAIEAAREPAIKPAATAQPATLKPPRGNGASAQIVRLLATAPRPLFCGEIVAQLDFAFDNAEIASALVKLTRQGKVQSSLQARTGPGPKMAKVYGVGG
ncbi:hypothetical protein SAMN02745857_04276 [Andreprevotia lacus DSM 23236]|jgi:hypothetical protein|uniref:DprA winged helix domain-containing protein n=1 Tax=Andreprevotia lacus DSM 23236 TaxID=1121001 RepID=A0A1W1Y198_9NEIS|nr:hypothetical protein [Andreprevotia lacus]SMC29933.1 hypothetical protein SAMN02745857_04276 [Andreprevotia lacus DSM 23236]